MLLQWHVYLCLGRKKVLSWAMSLLRFSQYIIWDLGTSRCCLSNPRFLCSALTSFLSLAFLLHLANGVLFSFEASTGPSFEASTGARLTFLLVWLFSFTPVFAIFSGLGLLCRIIAIFTKYYFLTLNCFQLVQLGQWQLVLATSNLLQTRTFSL